MTSSLVGSMPAQHEKSGFQLLYECKKKDWWSWDSGSAQLFVRTVLFLLRCSERQEKVEETQLEGSRPGLVPLDVPSEMLLITC